MSKNNEELVLFKGESMVSCGQYSGIESYDLMNDRHLHFNIWQATTVMGYTYLESFPKGYDPNIRLRNIQE